MKPEQTNGGSQSGNSGSQSGNSGNSGDNSGGSTNTPPSDEPDYDQPSGD
jgi:hypothetical protein